MNNPVMHPERELAQEERDEILAIGEDDITASLFSRLFSRRPDGTDPRFYSNDYFKLPTSRFNTKKEVYTTIGIYLMNVFLIQPKFAKFFGYVNKSLKSKTLEDIEGKIANLLYTDQISTDDMADYYNRSQWLGGNKTISLLSPSLTSSLLSEPKDIIIRKKELFAQYAEELKPTNPSNGIISARIEKELVELSEDYIRSQDGAENFDSGAKINVSNNYKNMNVLRGAIRNSYDGKYRVNDSNYNTGISKEEYSSFADASVLGSYMRAINTEKGGYMAKESNQGLVAVKAALKGSDCGTTRTMRTFLYPRYKNEYLYRYIIDPKLGLTELTLDNWNAYENTWVELRSPIYCLEKEPCYCNICIGNQPYMLGLENFGLAISRIPNKLMNLSLKSFHSSNVKASKIPADDLFEEL